MNELALFVQVCGPVSTSGALTVKPEVLPVPLMTRPPVPSVRVVALVPVTRKTPCSTSMPAAEAGAVRVSVHVPADPVAALNCAADPSTQSLPAQAPPACQ